MKEQYISGLSEGERVDSTFLLRTKELRSSRTGECYLHLELADRTGYITAVRFRPDPAQDAAPTGTVVRVRGRVTTYRSVRRISVEQMRPAESFDRFDLFPGPKHDRGETERGLRRAIASVKQPSFSALLHQVFDDSDFFPRFMECPAAQSYHHSYLGGLAEHTLAVARICERLAALYDVLDEDLLVTCALLHDVGKVDELSFESGIDYTDEGRLLGHVVLGERRVREAAAACEELSAERLMHLSHVLLSHHGELEWGAPKRPSTLEALLLHHADDLDAKAAGFMCLIESACAAEERWTDSTNLFRRPLYAPTSASADRWVPVTEDEQLLRRSA